MRTLWVYSIESLVITFIFFRDYLSVSLGRLIVLWILSILSVYLLYSSRRCMFLTLFICFLCIINKSLWGICSSICICAYHCALYTSLTPTGICLCDFVKHCATLFSISSDFTEKSSIDLFKSHHILGC